MRVNVVIWAVIICYLSGKNVKNSAIYLTQVSQMRLLQLICIIASQQISSRCTLQLKFIYSEKATKFCEIFPLLLTSSTWEKSTVKISQNFEPFSEYMNFKAKVIRHRGEQFLWTKLRFGVVLGRMVVLKKNWAHYEQLLRQFSYDFFFIYIVSSAPESCLK